jgi:hypothetical protein
MFSGFNGKICNDGMSVSLLLLTLSCCMLDSVDSVRNLPMSLRILNLYDNTSICH